MNVMKTISFHNKVALSCLQNWQVLGLFRSQLMLQQRTDAVGRISGTLSMPFSLQASYLPGRMRRGGLYGGMSANMATLKITGRKSQTNTVTMEARFWRESKPQVYSGRQMVLHTHKHTHTEPDL